MPRSRRSLQARSTRARAIVRAFLRPGAAQVVQQYVAEGRTLITPNVRAQHDRLRAERVGRAKVEITSAKHMARYAAAHLAGDRFADQPDSALLPYWLRDRNRRKALVSETKATLVAAQAELKAAKRSATLRPADPLVLAPRASLPEPRCWPNAAPGGTSPRRAAKRASWVVEMRLPADVPASWLEPLP